MTPLPLDQVHDEGTFGGKAVALGRALRAALPVPAGHALPVALVRAVAEEESAACEGVRAFFEANYAGRRVAARSSAVGEDSAGASFAGQHLTRLGVASAEALVEAVAEVWRSGRSEGALAYRRRLGLDGEPRVAVVVQAMLDPTAAGVLFSRDPVDGSDRVVIEAAWGLGEIVVSGLVVPDRWSLDPSGRVIERVPGHKDLAIALAGGGETREVELPPERHAALCLDAAQVGALAALASRCEAVFGGPQDIEWAVADGSVHLLQSRPITR